VEVHITDSSTIRTARSRKAREAVLVKCSAICKRLVMVRLIDMLFLRHRHQRFSGNTTPVKKDHLGVTEVSPQAHINHQTRRNCVRERHQQLRGLSFIDVGKDLLGDKTGHACIDL